MYIQLFTRRYCLQNHLLSSGSFIFTRQFCVEWNFVIFRVLKWFLIWRYQMFVRWEVALGFGGSCASLIVCGRLYVETGGQHLIWIIRILLLNLEIICLINTWTPPWRLKLSFIWSSVFFLNFCYLLVRLLILSNKVHLCFREHLMWNFHMAQN